MKKFRQFILLSLISFISLSAECQEFDDRGATAMPYERYESEDASLGNGADLRDAPDFVQTETAAEASNQEYVSLPGIGAYLEWNIQQEGNGVTMRFTMPDASDGSGLSGSLALFVNGQFVRDIELSSYWAYQYFPNSDPENAPGNRPRMRFDEINFILDNALQPGDVLRIENTTGDYEYGVDFIELEDVSDPIPKPSGYLDVTDFGATPDDATDDLPAFYSALSAAEQAGTGIYIPAGRFVLNNLFVFEYNNIGMIGAGMWYTELYFTNMEKMSGGIIARCSDVEIAHFRMNTNNNRRFYNPGDYMNYKGLMGTYGNNSNIHHLWITHFECGAWIGGYDEPYPIDVTSNMTFAYNRIRNNYADGINLCQGTNNSVVEQCNFRNNGDDAIAVWPNNDLDAPMGVNNIFRYNTVENNFRAAGIAIFGGSGHEVYNNLIKDGFAGSGIRLTTDFPGYHFEDNEGIYFRDNTIIRCGTSYDLWNFHRGAVEINATNYGIRNVHFENLDIIDAQRHAVQIGSNGAVNEVSFDNVTVDGYGLDGVTESLYTSPTPGMPVCSYGGSSGAVSLNCFFVGSSDFNTTDHLYKANSIDYSVTQTDCGEKPIEGIALEPSSGLSLAVGEVDNIDISYVPGNTTEKDVNIAVSSDGIISVSQITSQQLEVTGLTVGTATLTVSSAANESIFDEVTVEVLPTINVSALDEEIEEGGTSGSFEILAYGITEPVGVNYQVDGSAFPEDYDATPELSGSVTIDPEDPSEIITISALADDVFEGEETVILSLETGEGYKLGTGSATITILDLNNPPCNAPVIAYTSSAPSINSTIGAEWEIAPAMSVGNVVVGTQPSDYGGQWRAMYDESGLYVLVEVQDDVLQGGTGSEWWNDDAVEIYIDGNNSKNSSYDGIDDFQMAFGWNDGTVNLGSNSVRNTTGIEFNMWESSDGYNCMAFVPWSTIGVTPAVGMQLGFDVAIDDNDGGGRSQIASFANTEMAWSDPGLFGSVYLTTCDGSLEDGLHADAGVDQIVMAENGTGEVVLDASGSFHSSGTIASYVWSLDGVQIATGVNPVLSLEEGEYNILLTVTDEAGNYATDQVKIVVVSESLPDYAIVRTNASVYADQTIEEAWSNAISYGIDIEAVNTRPEGFDASWRALYDDDNLYLLVEVSGVSPVNDSQEYWNDDAIDIFLDADNSKNGEYDRVNDFQYGFRWNDTEIHVGNNSVNNASGIDFSMYRTDDGYTLEVVIPWTTLGIVPEADMLLGFDVGVNVDGSGGERSAQMVSFGTEMNWSNPSSFGSVPLLYTNATDITAGSEKINEESYISAYPVPFQDRLVLEWCNGFVPRLVKILDLTGRTVLMEQIPDNAVKKVLSVEKLKRGVYFILLEGTPENILKKAVKY